MLPVQLSIQTTKKLSIQTNKKTTKQLKTHPRAFFIVVFGCVGLLVVFGLFGFVLLLSLLCSVLFYFCFLCSALFLFLFLVEWSVMGWKRRRKEHQTKQLQYKNTKTPKKRTRRERRNQFQRKWNHISSL